VKNEKKLKGKSHEKQHQSLLRSLECAFKRLHFSSAHGFIHTSHAYLVGQARAALHI